MARIKYYNKQTGQWEYADNVLASGSQASTPEDIGAVPITRKINNKKLNKDITLTAEDVDAVPADGATPMTGNLQMNNHRVKDVAVPEEDGDAVNLGYIRDHVYPVGSIYMSVVNVSPTSFLGGTWEQLKDRFLLGAGDTYSNGASGGEANVTLTVETIPDHSHVETIDVNGLGTLIFDGSQDSTGWNKEYSYGDNLKIKAQPDSVIGTTSGTALTTVGTGGGKAHNNMPPYLAVYMWKRIA